MEQYRQNNNGYYPQKNNNSSTVIGRILLVLISMVFIGIGAFIIYLGFWQKESEEEMEKNYVDVEAQIFDIKVHGSGDNRTHTVFIEYMYEGKKYEDKLNYYSSTMDVGDVVEIKCNPSNPKEFMSKGFIGKMSIILWIIGGVFIGVTLIIMIVCLVASKRKKNISVYGNDYNRPNAYYNDGELREEDEKEVF